jgi:broad specificity phosphatase PhoE
MWEIEDLSDVDHGRWEDLDQEVISKTAPELWERFRDEPLSMQFPGGGSVPEFERKLFAALALLCEVNAGLSFVVVTHELPIRLLLARFFGGR